VSHAAAPELEQHASWSDEHLVAECVGGSEEAWSALIDKYKNLIFSIPIKMGLYDDAADIFQAVCLDLLLQLPRLREPRALPKWLMQACYHKCIDHCRRTQREFGPDQNGDAAPAAAVGVLPEEMIAQVEREQMTRQAITSLSERCQRLVHMLFFEEPPRPYQAIAADLGIATGSIGFIRGRCLARLRKELQSSAGR
jgi:RNA polymerase sigma factor (sigma-70 family)